MREQGYFVDLNEKNLIELKNFKISLNRHKGKYDSTIHNSNYALYNTKYYYVDQNINIFKGDPDFYNKLWKLRSRIKPYLASGIGLLIILNINFKIRLKKHQNARKFNKKNI